jgi:hypothetical protein
MAIWFGSVQGLAIVSSSAPPASHHICFAWTDAIQTLTFALYNLCSHPEYIQPLREEIASPEGAQFLITGDGLPLMDSFLKECSRWTPVESGMSLNSSLTISPPLLILICSNRPSSRP